MQSVKNVICYFTPKSGFLTTPHWVPLALSIQLTDIVVLRHLNIQYWQSHQIASSKPEVSIHYKQEDILSLISLFNIRDIVFVAQY